MTKSPKKKYLYQKILIDDYNTFISTIPNK